jgi:hypothetical protein
MRRQMRVCGWRCVPLREFRLFSAQLFKLEYGRNRLSVRTLYTCASCVLRQTNISKIYALACTILVPRTGFADTIKTHYSKQGPTPNA